MKASASFLALYVLRVFVTSMLLANSNEIILLIKETQHIYVAVDIFVPFFHVLMYSFKTVKFRFGGYQIHVIILIVVYFCLCLKL